MNCSKILARKQTDFVKECEEPLATLRFLSLFKIKREVSTEHFFFFIRFWSSRTIWSRENQSIIHTWITEKSTPDGRLDNRLIPWKNTCEKVTDGTIWFFKALKGHPFFIGDRISSCTIMEKRKIIFTLWITDKFEPDDCSNNISMKKQWRNAYKQLLKLNTLRSTSVSKIKRIFKYFNSSAEVKLLYTIGSKPKIFRDNGKLIKRLRQYALLNGDYKKKMSLNFCNKINLLYYETRYMTFLSYL